MVVSNFSWFSPLIGSCLVVPFMIFACLNAYPAIRRGNYLAVLYWSVNVAYTCVILVWVPVLISRSRLFIYLKPKHTVVLIATSPVLGAIYGISLFVFWWLRPGFYYRWDEGRRKQD
jgi:hypothetical protein